MIEADDVDEDSVLKHLEIYLGPDVLPRVKNKQTGGGFKWSGPRLPRKNEYWRIAPRGQGGIHPTPLAKAFVKALRTQLTIDGFSCSQLSPLITTGRWMLTLIVFVPQQYKNGILAGTPKMDADACLSPVKDALEGAGVLPDKHHHGVSGDGLIDCDLTVRLHRPTRPGLLIRLNRLVQHDQDALMAGMYEFGGRVRELLFEGPQRELLPGGAPK